MHDQKSGEWIWILVQGVSLCRHQEICSETKKFWWFLVAFFLPSLCVVWLANCCNFCHSSMQLLFVIPLCFPKLSVQKMVNQTNISTYHFRNYLWLPKEARFSLDLSAICREKEKHDGLCCRFAVQIKGVGIFSTSHLHEWIISINVGNNSQFQGGFSGIMSIATLRMRTLDFRMP